MTDAGPGGSAGRPRTPEVQIVDGARRALVGDPRASMRDIAREAGVGMSALYACFSSREELLRRFAAEANEAYARALDAATRGLDEGRDAGVVLRDFLTELVDADLHPLLLAISGTFERSEDDLAESWRLSRVGVAFVRRCHDQDALRAGTAWLDLPKLLEAVTAVHGASPARTRSLRLRLLDIALTGLTTGPRPLVEQPPDGADFAENRQPRAGKAED